jgi:outer membrane receptor for Fe3+-dicitrate
LPSSSTKATASAFSPSTVDDELNIELDIIQATISRSVHYRDVNLTNAVISFCLRIDYNYVDNDNITESVNFYETNVTINVGLTANFTLTGINADRTAADNEAANAILDYLVEAFTCLDDNSEV